MKADDLLELAARNLRESVLRNSLTTLGIGMGVASLVAMLSLGIGLPAQRRIVDQGENLERPRVVRAALHSERSLPGRGKEVLHEHPFACPGQQPQPGQACACHDRRVILSAFHAGDPRLDVPSDRFHGNVGAKRPELRLPARAARADD